VNPLTEEFVHRYRFLTKCAEDDPDKLVAALDEYPDLAVSVARLQEIVRDPRWLIDRAHSDFRTVLRDYRDRWASASQAVASLVYSRIYERAALRVREEFLGRYRYLIELTADNPAAIKDLGVRRPDFAYAFGVLDVVHRAVSEPEDAKYFRDRHAKAGELRRLIAQGPPEFHRALADFAIRWREQFAQLVEKHSELSEFIGTGPEQYPEDLGLPGQGPLRRIQAMILYDPGPPSRGQSRALKHWRRALVQYEYGWDWLNALLDRLPDAPRAEDPTRPFDPRQDSATEAIAYSVKFVAEERFGDFEFDVGEAFDWMHHNGMDLGEIERRMKAFPEIVVPTHVSDHYQREAPRGLYALLTQVRLAHVIGADLAAIALCRSVTELLIRYHYAYDIPNATVSKGKEGKNLRWLIEQVQTQKESDFLRNFNLIAKVDAANDILHQATTRIEHRNQTRGLLIEWVSVLAEMIDRAPGGIPAMP
jgi:hypothetical protein